MAYLPWCRSQNKNRQKVVNNKPGSFERKDQLLDKFFEQTHWQKICNRNLPASLIKWFQVDNVESGSHTNMCKYPCGNTHYSIFIVLFIPTVANVAIDSFEYWAHALKLSPLRTPFRNHFDGDNANYGIVSSYCDVWVTLSI